MTKLTRQGRASRSESVKKILYNPGTKQWDRVLELDWGVGRLSIVGQQPRCIMKLTVVCAVVKVPTKIK